MTFNRHLHKRYNFSSFILMFSHTPFVQPHCVLCSLVPGVKRWLKRAQIQKIWETHICNILSETTSGTYSVLLWCAKRGNGLWSYLKKEQHKYYVINKYYLNNEYFIVELYPPKILHKTVIVITVVNASWQTWACFWQMANGPIYDFVALQNPWMHIGIKYYTS